MPPSFNGLLHGGTTMSMQSIGAAAASGGVYPQRESRARGRPLEKLSSGFRIDGSAGGAPPATSTGARGRTASLENAVRTASQNLSIRSQADNAPAELNANLVRQKATGGSGLSAGPGSGQLDAYA